MVFSGIDSSLPALELAKENIVLNNMDPGRISFVKEDATVFMKDALSGNESWDIVILDPPKLAPRKKVKSRHLFVLLVIDFYISIMPCKFFSSLAWDLGY